MALHIENAHLTDRETVISLLQKGKLLTDDLPLNLSDFVVAKEQNSCVGVAGLQRVGSVALLRSVAVDPQYQNRQIGAQLIEKLLDTAKEAGLDEVYLITTSADHYFGRHGFKPIAREAVPATIRQTPQFSDLCPASAVVMKQVLTKQTP